MAIVVGAVSAGLAEAVLAQALLTYSPEAARSPGTLSLVAVPANLLAVPAIAPATLFGWPPPSSPRL